MASKAALTPAHTPAPQRDPPSGPPVRAPGSRVKAARRLVGATGLSLALSVVAAAILVYVFLYRRIGYFFFDISDIPIYFRYSSAIARGLRPFVDFGVEYPPLALPLFSLAGPPPFDADLYAARFAPLMLATATACGATTTAAAARIWRSGPRPYVVAAAFAGAMLAVGAIIANRYDVAVALVVAAAMLLAIEGWHEAAAIALGIGFGLKLVPAILLPLVLVLARRPRRIAGAVVAFAVSAALPFVPYLPEGAGGLAQMFTYHRARPLQVESVLATPFFVHSLLGGGPVPVARAFGSDSVAMDAGHLLARGSTYLELAALVATYALVWRRRATLRACPAAIPLAVTAALLAFLAFGKVLSPQYFVWLLPCIALVVLDRPALGAVLFATLLLTQVEFPALYLAFTDGSPGATWCVVLRNVGVVAAFVLALLALWRLPAEPAPEPSRRVADAARSSTGPDRLRPGRAG